MSASIETICHKALLKNFSTNSLQTYVDSLVDSYNLPALSLAIWHNDHLHQAAAGVLNVETGVEATPESTFQIGSVTKVVTATLIMQLVDQGRVDLDAPVKRYLRDFQVADADATARVTVRHLLNHTNGLDGDFFPDEPPTGGNPIARYVDRCCLLSQVHALGEKHSYSNTAYAIAGRLIEVVMGISWFNAVEEQIIQPLGLKNTFVDPVEAIRFRAAMGHMPTKEDAHPWTLAPTCYPPLGQAPAGSTLNMSAADLLTFARAHLSEGAAISGRRLLSADAVRLMQTSMIKLPCYTPGFITDWGLGWFLINPNNTSIIGHDGATFGQMAMLRLVPSQNLAFAVQVNGLKTGVLPTIFTDLMAALADQHFEVAAPTATLENPEKLIGKFETLGDISEIFLKNGELMASMADKVLSTPATTVYLKPLDTYSFATYSEQGERLSTLIFVDPDDEGVPQYLYSSCRLQRRVK